MPIQVRCHPFFVRVIVVGTKVALSRVFIYGDQPGGSQGSRKLTSAWRDIFRIRVFFVRVVVGEPIFGWSIKLGTGVG